eukprot:CAMPEP_0183607652 /NCGR_PEP_ID=MMETSP0371-20130417/183567_1 /TAXON_ID=268820 /ORGANISM="Peridinium aciculiferum, Strain PAER-2" /LENGTH=335 /DNA_ID=CAMNT_0025819775 /DNA_START=1 /DNA_END=1005 /DNA_ORIENTATION=-
MACKFIWGEVTELDGQERTATIQPMFVKDKEVIDFDFCIIAAGCNFGVFHKWGESLWFPTIHAKARPEGSWPHLDERFLEGRRRHIFEEYKAIGDLNAKNASVLVVGAGFIGVEWITELEHFFKNLKLTIIDALPQCLGPLPAKAATYCSKYMQRHGIKEHYNMKYKAIGDLNAKNASVLVVGAGFIGVEWITELEHFFKNLKLTIIDALPQCLGPLPAKAATYCSKYMQRHGIKEHYNMKYNAKDPNFYASVGLPNGPDKEYVCIGVKASNYFMPAETLSEKGPGGGGWILMDMNLAVKTRDGKVWSKDEQGYPRIFAIGDCNYGCVDGPGPMD